jgi:hypothetical protein
MTKQTLPLILTSLGYEVVPEFQFCKDRKFRADWRVSKGKESVLIEYEGIFNPSRSKTRHTTLTGYTKDTEKYNLMAKMGYKCLRYTAKNIGDVVRDLETIL